MSHQKSAACMVVKCGTEVLYPGVWDVGAPHLTTRFGYIARQIVAAETNGTSSVLISSGAKRSGQEAIKMTSSVFRLGRKEEWAGIGTRHLLNRWGDAFDACGKEIAYILVSRTWRGNRTESEAIISAIRSYQRCDIVPILNENDVVLDPEYGASENDRLAREIAELIGSDAILFLTGCGGVYEENPTGNPHARRYAEIDARTALTDPRFTHGMGRKLAEAVWCFAIGMRVAIAGVEGNTISKFAAGEPAGTMIGNSVKFY